MNPKITLSSTNQLIDQSLKLQITGLKPNQQVKIQAEMKDDVKRTWHSFGIFTADYEGNIDLDTTAPNEGSYTGCDPNGLLWSMQIKDSNSSFPPIFFKMSTQSHKVSFYLLIEEKIKYKSEVQINFTNSDTEQIVVQNSIVGKLFKSKEKNNLPAVIVVGGSTGGLFWTEQMAALLSSKGYAALALNYFDVQNDNLPSELIEIKIEYFKKALDWLKSKPEIDKNNISIMGISKGGELSLLFGSFFSKHLTSIITYVPSSHVFEGISMEVHQTKSSWTYKNTPIEFVQYPSNTKFSKNMNPIDIRIIHDNALNSATSKQLDSARIPIENIACPILMISGERDTTWPSSKMCRDMIQNLEENNNPYQSKHLNFCNMGHTFFLPNIPPMIDHPSVNVQNAASANKKAWEATLNFLDKHTN
ncbi:acyl-CoA thioesterase/BAAT N-terminal domain-containing protein [Clostridium sp. D2Q-11]|uniref:Acyl-CoA thioesterase/BAAT N-terminal domain-containing protein n=1 Tax=Anaeromonas frigoriresistens TaxID=2683708 RepID=A0A942UWP3_9FIRM|nr:acyl-CoA thioesterase/bile acid-CoA:amino acid N-acyltransferase family protein [Anaeromonas frigoriresistens]MBS4539475.1 acyl-CoA thioesterase/BAAT N-terminal domain-containing protein [Anaeromonas frigoriresistens]